MRWPSCEALATRRCRVLIAVGTPSARTRAAELCGFGCVSIGTSRVALHAEQGRQAQCGIHGQRNQRVSTLLSVLLSTKLSRDEDESNAIRSSCIDPPRHGTAARRTPK